MTVLSIYKLRCLAARLAVPSSLWTPCTAAHQAPLSIGFFRQEYWSGLVFPRPGDLPDPGIELVSPTALAAAGRFFTTEPPGKPHILRPHGLQPTRLCPGNSLGNNTGVDSHSVLQGIFPTQGSNLGLLHCGQILYHLNHQGNLYYKLGLSKCQVK